MNLELKNKVVLIAGASQGIGYATALAFAREGARVAIVLEIRILLRKQQKKFMLKPMRKFQQPPLTLLRQKPFKVGLNLFLNSLKPYTFVLLM